MQFYMIPEVIGRLNSGPSDCRSFVSLCPNVSLFDRPISPPICPQICSRPMSPKCSRPPKIPTTQQNYTSMASLDDRMTALINLQNFNGSFTCSADKWDHSVLHYYFGNIDNVIAGCPKDLDFDIWTTALAIKILEFKMLEKKDLWELVAKKGGQCIMQHFNANINNQEQYSKLMTNAEHYITTAGKKNNIKEVARNIRIIFY